MGGCCGPGVLSSAGSWACLALLRASPETTARDGEAGACFAPTSPG